MAIVVSPSKEGEGAVTHISDWSLSLDLRILTVEFSKVKTLQQRWTRIKTWDNGHQEIEERWEDVPVGILPAGIPYE